MHALITAIVLWSMAIAIVTFGSAYRDPFGQLKWTDFVHFFTLGHIARNGPVSDLYDPQAQHRHQVALVPESAPEHYLPVYPPQIALVFAPFGNLPYRMAAALWALLNIAVYGASVWLAWRSVRGALANYSLVAVSAAAFPPFWSLVLHGQTTAVAIVAFTGGAIALSHGRKVLAGIALGLLLMKPQFGLLLAVVVLTCGEWSILGGLALSAGLQLIAVASLLGHSVVLEYLQVVPRLAAVQSALEPSVVQMHSLAALTQLLPGHVATGAWLIASAGVSWMTVRIWRSAAPPSWRMGALVIGSVLVNPHVNLYDVTVIAAPLVSLTGWLEAQSGRFGEVRRRWHSALYALFVLLLFPTARLIGIQLSLFVLMFLMYSVWRLAADPLLNEGVQCGDRRNSLDQPKLSAASMPGLLRRLL